MYLFHSVFQTLFATDKGEFGQLIISIVAVMLDFAVMLLFFDQIAQRVVAVTGALVLGKAVAVDSASVGKVVGRVVAVVVVCTLGNSAQCVIGVIPAAVGLVVGTDEVADSVVLVTATDKDGRVCFVVTVRLGDLLFQTA